MTASLAERLPLNIAPIEPSKLIWLAFAVSVAASTLPAFIGGVTGPMAYMLAIVGSAGCGWLWLLARTLFRTSKPVENWTLYTLGAIIIVEGGSNMLALSPRAASTSELYRVVGNTEAFVCFGAITMVFAEVFIGFSGNLTRKERRFRLTFVAAFGTLTAITLLWAMNARGDSRGGQWKETIFLMSALMSVVGTRLCIAYRAINPLSEIKRSKCASRPVEDSDLAARIEGVLRQDMKFATPDLKVADLANMLGDHEYKVTQCITGSLGYRNFNHMINSYRIDSAKEALSNPRNEGVPILSIAFDCGFNSIGPFNRAFKEQVGMTPREYRASSR
jgi:AraC-like DNA-binding protein